MTKPPRMTDAEITAEAARHVAEYRATICDRCGVERGSEPTDGCRDPMCPRSLTGARRVV